MILAVQNWIFGCEYTSILRQGDLAMIPVSKVPKETPIETNQMLLEKSHMVIAEEFRQNGNLYAKNPNMVHDVHPTVSGQGWYKIIVGKRSNFWNFAAPTID